MPRRSRGVSSGVRDRRLGRRRSSRNSQSSEDEDDSSSSSSSSSPSSSSASIEVPTRGPSEEKRRYNNTSLKRMLTSSGSKNQSAAGSSRDDQDSGSLDLASLFFGKKQHEPENNTLTTVNRSSDGDEEEEDEVNDSDSASKESSSRADGDAQAVQMIATQETRFIRRLRWLVLGILFLATALVSFTIFYNTRKLEEEKFDTAFSLEVSKVQEGLLERMDRTLAALDHVATSIIEDVAAQGDTWPLVTLSPSTLDASALSLTGTEFLGLVPLVSSTDRPSWEAHVLQTATRTLKEEIDVPKGPVSVPTSPPASSPTSGTQQDSEGAVDKPTQPPASAPATNAATFQSGIATTLFRLEPTSGEPVVEPRNSLQYLPLWQQVPRLNLVSPPTRRRSLQQAADRQLVNFNLLSGSTYASDLQTAQGTKEIVIGVLRTQMQPYRDPLYRSLQSKSSNPTTASARSNLYIPLMTSSTSPAVVGELVAVLDWASWIETQVEDSSKRVLVVLEDTCGHLASYELLSSSSRPIYMGGTDRHDSRFNSMEEEIAVNLGMNFTTFSGIRVQLNASESCQFKLRVYPTSEMEDQYLTRLPLIYTVATGLVFLFTVCLFLAYDYLVERRQRLVLDQAVQSSAVVSSLFPAMVRDRLFPTGSRKNIEEGAQAVSAKRRLKSFLDEGRGGKRSSSDIMGRSRPIADLFPDATVLFADIAGFTAWSSTREPSQVFTLLEAIYATFDKVAKKRSVFKVETIGDCYMAVTGLPDPQSDHAERMAKFSWLCLTKMRDLVEELEVSLGPGTADLQLRCGLHSGPVTAGVLRGEKSRFQLFGDTVNTAARMESTGKPDNIQCSQSTADLLIAAHRTQWICPREDVVVAKGKGKVQTYWIDLGNQSGVFGDSGSIGSLVGSRRSFGTSMATSMRDLSRSLVWGEGANNQSKFMDMGGTVEEHKHQRLIDWNVRILGRLLKQVVAARKPRLTHSSSYLRISAAGSVESNESKGKSSPMSKRAKFTVRGFSNPIKEVSEAIPMPQFDRRTAKPVLDTDRIELSSSVLKQLKAYVTEIADRYHDTNPFHNFEHASHVTQSANKLLKRVVAPDEVYDGHRKDSMRKIASHLHSYTYGMSSDPLTQFAIVLSALIHDVEHCGVSNMQLVKEETANATKYRGKSVAEQTSVDVSWNILMRDDYKDLQEIIYTDETEYKRFRKLLVNSVIATDIFDKDLKEFRNKRWAKAFHSKNAGDDTNLMATIVIEHIIQAADVSHTMQHWHVYTKWNERLFQEMYEAYRSGRGGDKDPSEGWYKGELWFFDNYVIPLAKKLKECNVFGVASAECLNYAQQNRAEWEDKGQRIVDRMLERYKAPRWARQHRTTAAMSVAAMSVASTSTGASLSK